MDEEGEEEQRKKRGNKEDLTLLDMMLTARDEEDEGITERGRRFIRWTKRLGLEKNLTNYFMNKIRENVHNSFFTRHTYSYWLQHIEDKTIMLFHHNPNGG